MRRAVSILLSLLVIAVASFLGYDMATYYLYSPWTRDARIRADVITVAPDVSGYVTDVLVRNDQLVHKGDLLFTIDQERFRLALADASATAAARLAQYRMLLQQYERRSKLTNLSVSEETVQNARQQADGASASHQQAIADRDLAGLNLKRTEIRASVNGYVSNLNLVKGDYATTGKPVLALIDSDSFRVDAYFEETKIPQITLGSPVDIRLMNGAPALRGSVASIAHGITDQDNHDGPELLASVNPTFTWVRLAQRIPVRIRLTEVPPGVLVSAGMTCTVILKDGTRPHIGASFESLWSAITSAAKT